jgi:hypothetical protein
MKINDLIKLDEPLLLFSHNQALEDPRDGLTLFGPLITKPPYWISYGIVGTRKGIERFYRWENSIQQFLSHRDICKRDLWIPFPGFESAFGIPFSEKAVTENEIDDKYLVDILQEDDSFQRVHKTVDLYARPILDFYAKADENLDVWFVISPEEVFKTCRPTSKIVNPKIKVTGREIKARQETSKKIKLGQQSFLDSAEDYEAYEFDNDFRRQLKARLILEKIKNPIQIVRETTLTPDDFLNEKEARIRDIQPESQVAWNLLSTILYKAGGKPWKLSGIREGVCYLGMVYKRLEREHDPRSACCAAQMFLDSGDGVVFKGAVGPWKSPVGEQYHLSRGAAKEIIERALQAYAEYFGVHEKPKEIFIHGRTYLNDEEWEGFTSVVDSDTKVVGIRIRQSALKLFRQGDYFLLRGMAYIENKRVGHLWTTGYIPRLSTSPFQGVPIPLRIEICKGESDIKTVLQDIYALTKLNYNSCHYGDSEPITLRFADNIGDILTAGPIKKDEAPLPFKFYV